jgi:hypothetical protein
MDRGGIRAGQEAVASVDAMTEEALLMAKINSAGELEALVRPVAVRATAGRLRSLSVSRGKSALYGALSCAQAA